MSSKTILPIDLTDDIPKNDCTGTNQHGIENPVVQASTQVVLDATSGTTHAAVESNTDKQDEKAQSGAENISTKSKTIIDESSKGMKDGNVDDMETNDNNKVNNECSTLTSSEDNLKVEYSNKRIAKQFRVSSTNKIHKDTGGKVNKIYFGTVENLIPGKANLWRILYDDGDVDIMSRTNVLDALKYYDINKKYDTNHAHKKKISPFLETSEEVDGKSAMKTATASTTKKRTKHLKTKATPPKKGKNTKAKVSRQEALPVWTGLPDENMDGGWPKGWVKKIFARKNGATKGSTDRYWYSPKEKFKLRSMVQVKKFLKALAVTKGDEKKAKQTMNNY